MTLCSQLSWRVTCSLRSLQRSDRATFVVVVGQPKVGEFRFTEQPQRRMCAKPTVGVETIARSVLVEWLLLVGGTGDVMQPRGPGPVVYGVCLTPNRLSGLVQCGKHRKCVEETPEIGKKRTDERKTDLSAMRVSTQLQIHTIASQPRGRIWIVAHHQRWNVLLLREMRQHLFGRKVATVGITQTHQVELGGRIELGSGEDSSPQ
mmetsp:Transcript_26115/g.65636  ORF Transcript_26115/g.65636 Transcript_26115/m.65636 type:complete len:205 (+) Transcript_26115:173-787(+)